MSSSTAADVQEIETAAVRKGSSNKATSTENVTDWFEASFDYYKSPEGEAEYKKIGLPYPKTLMDYHYMQFLKLTKNTKKEDHKIEIHNMKRFITRDNKEYIIHDMRETKYDPIGNRKTFSRTGIGKYGKPIPKWTIKVLPEEGYEKIKVVEGIEGVDACYSIPFTQKNIDKLVKYCDGNTSYCIAKEDYQSGRRLSIRSLADWKNGTAEHLLRFGHIASDYEKQMLEDEKIGKCITLPPAGNQGAYR
jgi:hypothetical protein